MLSFNTSASSSSPSPAKPFADLPLVFNTEQIWPFHCDDSKICLCCPAIDAHESTKYAIFSIPNTPIFFPPCPAVTTASSQHTVLRYSHRIPFHNKSPRQLPTRRQRQLLVAILSQRGRPGGRADSVFPTDPQSSRVLPSTILPASLDADAPVKSRSTPFSSPKSTHPSTDNSPANLAAAAAATLNQSNSARQSPGRHESSNPPLSPFRPRAVAPALRRVRRLSAARLWNPTNSTPRPHTARKRRPSTPPPPSVPLRHPTLDDSKSKADPVGTGAYDYPLLTLPEQRQTRHSGSTRASLQVDRQGSSDHRVSLPGSVRASYDGQRSRNQIASAASSEAGPGSRGRIQEGEILDEIPVKLDKGKGKAIMTSQDPPAEFFSQDLERGPDIMNPRLSNVSADGIGSALSSTDSSIMGEEVEPDAAGEWGPQHPCYPHLNPHVPIDSPEYTNTRIIRIRRDWLLEGDLAPTFSNLYPEILDPAGLSEQEFRRVIEKLNGELIPAFNPYAWRSIVDNMLGLVTGWLWDDFGLTSTKSRLNNLEQWIEKWNLEMEKTVGSEDGAPAPKLVSLRRTGYMTLDIQIPDPEIAPAPSTNAGGSRTTLPLEPIPALTR